MADPFLHLHRVLPGMYELSGLRTTSIRDQMLRAYVAVKRIAKIGLIGPKRPLLVLGGGAAGVTAAMTAADLGIPVTLYEKEKDNFSRQHGSGRLIDPTEYDWPAAHWEEGRFPWSPGQIPSTYPLPYKADSATRLALNWSTAFYRWRASSPNAKKLTFRCGTPAGYLHPENVQFRPPDSVVALNPTTVQFERYGAALSCVGFAAERVHASRGDHPLPGEYQGFPFWSNDPYDIPDFDLPHLTDGPDIVISGGGDGALQDFIRVVGGPAAGPMYKRIRAMTKGKSDEHLYACLAADDIPRRAYPWLDDPKTSGHSVLQECHDRYLVASKEIFDQLDKSHEKESWLEDEHGKVHWVTLVHSCNHFDFCYGLNRLVALVLARLHAEKTYRQLEEVVQGGLGVKEVRAAPTVPSHTCNDPATCHGISHTVEFEPRQCPLQPPRPGLPNPIDADIVILRHGLGRNSSFGQAPIPNQTVPYWLDEP
jgi:hypothetical protein